MNKVKDSPSNSEAAASADPSDMQLVARCQQGDTSAFNELITRYRQRCFGMIYQMVRNEEDAVRPKGNGTRGFELGRAHLQAVSARKDGCCGAAHRRLLRLFALMEVA